MCLWRFCNDSSPAGFSLGSPELMGSYRRLGPFDLIKKRGSGWLLSPVSLSLARSPSLSVAFFPSFFTSLILFAEFPSFGCSNVLLHVCVSWVMSVWILLSLSLSLMICQLFVSVSSMISLSVMNLLKVCRMLLLPLPVLWVYGSDTRVGVLVSAVHLDICLCCCWMRVPILCVCVSGYPWWWCAWPVCYIYASASGVGVHMKRVQCL